MWSAYSFRAALVGLLALTGCQESPTSPPGSTEIGGFSIRRSGSEIFGWDRSDFSAADTFRVNSGNTIPVEFVWLGSDGEARAVSQSGAQLSVTVTQHRIVSWVGDSSEPFEGAFSIQQILQPLHTAMRVMLTIGEDTLLITSGIPMKVSP